MELVRVYSTDETLMRRYLLGMAPEEDQVRIEEQFFTDDSWYDQLQAIENELFYEYAQGDLSPSERAAFEQRFLSAPEDRERLAVAQGLAGRIARSVRPAAYAPQNTAAGPSWVRFFGEGAAATGLRWAALAATIFLVTATGWLLVETARLKRELTHLASQSEARERVVMQMAEALAGRHPGAGAGGGESVQPTGRPESGGARLEPRERAAVVSLVLSPGLVRGDAEPKRITLPRGTNLIRVELESRADAHYRRYRAALRNADGQQLWTGPAAPGLATADRRVTVSVPATKVPPGDYELILEGAAATGEWEELAEYYFSVRR